MERERIWLIVLSVGLALVTIGAIVAVATLRADLADLPGAALCAAQGRRDRQVAALRLGADPAAEQWSTQEEPEGWGEDEVQPAAGPTGRIQDVAASTGTLTLTVSVRFSGPADLLYEPPVLRGERADYRPTRASLEQARYDFLALTSTGQAQTTLVFQPGPQADEKLALVFNPNQQSNNVIAPQWKMQIRN